MVCALSYVSECDEYIQIFEYLNIFDPNIYSNICLYNNFDINIFGYLFVSKKLSNDCIGEISKSDKLSTTKRGHNGHIRDM